MTNFNGNSPRLVSVVIGHPRIRISLSSILTNDRFYSSPSVDKGYTFAYGIMATPSFMFRFNMYLYLHLVARGDVGDGPTGFLPDGLLGATQQVQ